MPISNDRDRGGQKLGSEADFTEEAYRELLGHARLHWRFGRFTEFQTKDRVCLWRHDVDFSPHRAARLAQLEAEAGVQATYFVLLQSTFYNVFEPGIAGLFRQIASLGHSLGVHFDPASYANHSEAGNVDRLLDFERRVLSELLDVTIEAFSYHNIDTARPFMSEADKVAGLVNAYSASIRANFAYVSDSNGYWRFQRLHDVLTGAEDPRLQVLTHPEWWTPTPMAPRVRVTRCIEGRARAQHRAYDDLLSEHGRTNVK
jgi:hypothetical protein